MLTPVQAALDGAMARLQNLFPKTVQLSSAPTKNLKANAGAFRRQRVESDTGFVWVTTGQVVLRAAVLSAAEVPVPESGQKILVDGAPYKIKHVMGDSTSYTLDCTNVS